MEYITINWECEKCTSDIEVEIYKDDVDIFLDEMLEKHIASLNDNKIELKRFICDLLEVNYHTPNEKVLELLKNKLNE